jgi:ADP-ribose pyrophosphatase
MQNLLYQEFISMEIKKRETFFEGKHLRVVNEYFTTDAGEEGVWETVEWKNIHGRGAVIITALTKANEVILERNWRFPIKSFVIQFPAGLTDREGEGEEETARRELLEETGYLAKEVVPFIVAPLFPVLTPIMAQHFLALDVEYVGGTSRDISEKIEVLKVPVEQLSDFLLHLPKDTMLDLRVPGIIWMLQNRGLLDIKAH